MMIYVRKKFFFPIYWLEIIENNSLQNIQIDKKNIFVNFCPYFGENWKIAPKTLEIANSFEIILTILRNVYEFLKKKI